MLHAPWMAAPLVHQVDHPRRGVLRTELRLLGAFFTIRRMLHAPWMAAPLVHQVDHPRRGVLRTELRLLSAAFSVRWPCCAAVLLAAP